MKIEASIGRAKRRMSIGDLLDDDPSLLTLLSQPGNRSRT
jgi:hypothetical protein